MDKTQRKLPFQARSLVNVQKTKFPPPPPRTQCCFLGQEQCTVSWQAAIPTSTLHKGEGEGGKSNGGRIKKGETKSDWSFSGLCSVVIA